MHKLRNLVALAITTIATAGPAMAEGESKIPNPTDGWNETWKEVLVDIWIIGIIFGVLAIYLLIKYKAKDPEAVGTAPKLDMRMALAWALIPSALFLADDFLLAAKGWTLWNTQRTVPAGSMEIKVTAAQWAFNFEYPNGIEVNSTDRDSEADLFSKEIMDGDLVIPVGKPIVLRMTSDDVLHSFGLVHYRLKEDIMPGRVTYLWFIAKEPKISNIVCVEFCGTNHSQMFNRVVAVPAAQYKAWLAKKKDEASLAANKKIRIASVKLVN